MRTDAIQLEEQRLQDVHDISDYHSVHERHRIFPELFESRNHKRILDIAAGVGVVGKRIQHGYPAEVICNDISPTCLEIMQKNGLTTVSFDIDHHENPYPFPENSFDAVVALAVIEHVINTEHFLKEIHRILDDNGCLYLSAPNYSGLSYLIPFLLTGRTFHDPMKEWSRYEFYAHVRYFTYATLLELVSSYAFAPDTVYLPLPKGSTRYESLRKKTRLGAWSFRHAMQIIYKISPRWAAEPVICFRKNPLKATDKMRQVLI